MKRNSGISDLTQHDEAAAALGVDLWTSDLFMPQYLRGEVGPWKISPGGQLVNDWGYFTGPCLTKMLPALERKVSSDTVGGVDRWDMWMSLTPHEIESQELGCRHARGHTVIMGLGMGWIAANVALNPRVSRVTIVELDRDVIELFARSGAYDSLPESAQRKITIMNANAVDWRPQDSDVVNFLYADIWLSLAEPSTISQVRQMQSNIQAATVYYWGQEIAIHCAAKRCVDEDQPFTADVVRQAIDEVIRLPLLFPDDCDYPRMIRQVIQNRIQRFKTVEVDLDIESC